MHLITIRTACFTQQKEWGLYQNKVNSSLAAIQRPGHQADNCKLVYYFSKLFLDTDLIFRLCRISINLRAFESDKVKLGYVCATLDEDDCAIINNAFGFCSFTRWWFISHSPWISTPVSYTAGKLCCITYFVIRNIWHQKAQNRKIKLVQDHLSWALFWFLCRTSVSKEEHSTDGPLFQSEIYCVNRHKAYQRLKFSYMYDFNLKRPNVFD